MMAKIVPNTCVSCGKTIGYVAEGGLRIPTMCFDCAHNEEIMKEWGHEIDDSL